MKKITLLVTVAFTFLIFNVHAQEAGSDSKLEGKKAELDRLEKEKAATEAKIATVTADIDAMSPEDKWKYGGFAQLNFGQAAFVNWAPGGENSISLTAVGNVFANYKKDKISWDNSFDGSWGMIRTSSTGFRKNEDKFELNSKVGYAISNKWNAALFLNVKSQFSETKDYTDVTEPVTSKFMAPGYLLFGIGADYKPNDNFSLFLSPLTAKGTLVLSDDIDETVYGLDAGDNVRLQVGAYLSAVYQKEDIIKNVSLWTKLDLFNDYTDNTVEVKTPSTGELYSRGNRGNIDVNWQARVSLKINKYISANVYGNLVYDHDTKVAVDTNDDGTNDSELVRTQFKETLGIGFGYKF